MTGVPSKFANENGNLAIMMALMAPAFVGAVGLSVETGYWYFLQERAQTAADVSAHAGGVALRNGYAAAIAIADAEGEASLQGYASPDAIVAVTSPVATGPFAGENGVEVVIAYSPPRFFSSIFNDDQITHSVRAVSRTTTGSSACILALNTSADRALYLTGSSTLVLDGCELMSNSLSDQAFYLTGSADADVDCINAVGGNELSGSGYTLSIDCGAPKSNQPPAADPYASVPEPNPDDHSCEKIEDIWTGTPTTKGKKATYGPPYTVDPGSDGVVRFCNGLSLKEEIDFAPGVYIVDGGKFQINATADVTGDDVTWYLTDDAEAQWNGSADIQFAAPTSGTYEGIIFMGDRSDSSSLHKFNGTADSELTGAIYTAGSDVEFLGDFSGAGGCMQIIADEIKISGSTDISYSCDSTGITWANVAGQLQLVE